MNKMKYSMQLGFTADYTIRLVEGSSQESNYNKDDIEWDTWFDSVIIGMELATDEK